MASYGDCDSTIEIRLAAETPDISFEMYDNAFSDDETSTWDDFALVRLLIEF